MINTTKDGRRQAVSIDGGPTIALLDERELGFALGEQDYAVRRIGQAIPGYELWRAEDKLAALAPHWPRDRYTLTAGERAWTLQRGGFGARRYGLFDGKERVGEVKSAGRWFRADLIADLPDALSTEIQVFVVWFALWQFSDPGS